MSCFAALSISARNTRLFAALRVTTSNELPESCTSPLHNLTWSHTGRRDERLPVLCGFSHARSGPVQISPPQRYSSKPPLCRGRIAPPPLFVRVQLPTTPQRAVKAREAPPCYAAAYRRRHRTTAA